MTNFTRLTSLCCAEGESQNLLTVSKAGFEQSVKPLTLNAPNVCPLFILNSSSSLILTSPSSSWFCACFVTASTVRRDFFVVWPPRTMAPLKAASLWTVVDGFDAQLWPFRQRFPLAARKRTMVKLSPKNKAVLTHFLPYTQQKFGFSRFLVAFKLRLRCLSFVKGLCMI